MELNLYYPYVPPCLSLREQKEWSFTATGLRVSICVTAVGPGKKKECLIKRHGNSLPVHFLVYFGVLLFSKMCDSCLLPCTADVTDLQVLSTVSQHSIRWHIQGGSNMTGTICV